MIIIALFYCNTVQGESVGLVLSGGGAKGLSHIGVIKALEEYNIPIDYICGTSMGAIVGSLYAAGLTPDEMVQLVKSPEFESWYKGLQERGYASYFYRDEAIPSMFTFAITRNKDVGEEKRNPFEPKRTPKLKIDFPTSIVAPYPMDLALIEVFAPASIAAGDKFDSLMIPFFCVAADVINKKPLVMKDGNLGSAVRASMAYPFVFKPVIIDTMLLFDGGFYNNFPWDIMVEEYNPDYVIGAKCVVGNTPIGEDDIISYVENMLMSRTNYDIPVEKGVVIERKYPFGMMDFHKADEIVEMGYKNTLLYIKEIKDRVKRERFDKELDSMRIAFKNKKRALMFNPELEIEGELDTRSKKFITSMIKGEDNGRMTYEDLKKGYYKVVSTNRFKTLYPYYEIGDDSLLTLKLRATKAAAWSVSIGGNISSSSFNQGFVGATYSHLSERPWKIWAGVNMGKYYKGGYLSWRHDVSVKPMAYYSLDIVAHQFDYDNVRQFECYGNVEFVTPFIARRNLFIKIGLMGGQERYKSSQYDKTHLTVFSPSVGVGRNTLDYPIYPTSGRREYAMLRYNYAMEWPLSVQHNKYLLNVRSEGYFDISSRFSLGYIADVVLSNKNKLENEVADMLYTPVFRPVPHSNTMIMEKYRANSYVGVGFSPVILFSNSLFLHSNISWFQPCDDVIKLDSGALIANVAFVWQSPIGPISLSTTYYEKGEERWHPQLNIGFLLFKKRALEF